MSVFVKRGERLVGESESKSEMREKPNKPQLRGVSLLVLETQCEHEGKKYASTVKVQSKENTVMIRRDFNFLTLNSEWRHGLIYVVAHILIPVSGVSMIKRYVFMQ